MKELKSEMKELSAEEEEEEIKMFFRKQRNEIREILLIGDFEIYDFLKNLYKKQEKINKIIMKIFNLKNEKDVTLSCFGFFFNPKTHILFEEFYFIHEFNGERYCIGKSPLYLWCFYAIFFWERKKRTVRKIFQINQISFLLYQNSIGKFNLPHDLIRLLSSYFLI